MQIDNTQLVNAKFMKSITKIIKMRKHPQMAKIKSLEKV